METFVENVRIALEFMGDLEDKSRIEHAKFILECSIELIDQGIKVSRDVE